MIVFMIYVMIYLFVDYLPFWAGLGYQFIWLLSGIWFGYGWQRLHWWVTHHTYCYESSLDWFGSKVYQCHMNIYLHFFVCFSLHDKGNEQKRYWKAICQVHYVNETSNYLNNIFFLLSFELGTYYFFTYYGMLHCCNPKLFLWNWFH